MTHQSSKLHLELEKCPVIATGCDDKLVVCGKPVKGAWEVQPSTNESTSHKNRRIILHRALHRTTTSQTTQLRCSSTVYCWGRRLGAQRTKEDCMYVCGTHLAVVTWLEWPGYSFEAAPFSTHGYLKSLTCRGI